MGDGVKRCSLCGVEKPTSEFYAKRDAKDGLDWACKPCKRVYFRERYAKRFRKRPIVPEGFKFCPSCKRVRPVEDFLADAARHDGRQVYCANCWPDYMAQWRKRKSTRAWARAKSRRRARLPEVKAKRWARLFTYLAVRFGYLVRQPCEVCGVTDVEAHHVDYSKPLEVRWLCFQHHGEIHRHTEAIGASGREGP